MTKERSRPPTGDKAKKAGERDQSLSLASTDSGVEMSLDSIGAIELTDVDLGEDLIEKTATLTMTNPDRAAALAGNGATRVEPAAPVGPSAAESLENARILMREGFNEDAKAALRKALIRAPKDAALLKLMREIQDAELKRLMRESTDSAMRDPRNSAESRDARNVPTEEDVEAVIAALDADLKLGILESTSLFQEHLVHPEALDACMVGSSAQDLIDLGVGFLQLGLFDQAIRLFVGAASPQVGGTIDSYRSATALLAEAQLLAGRPYESVGAMQPILRDASISPADKLQFFYLMGRCHEELGQMDGALQWFKQVAAHDPRFRDVQERLKTR